MTDSGHGQGRSPAGITAGVAITRLGISEECRARRHRPGSTDAVSGWILFDVVLTITVNLVIDPEKICVEQSDQRHR